MSDEEAVVRLKIKRDKIFYKLGKVAIVEALDIAIAALNDRIAMNKNSTANE